LDIFDLPIPIAIFVVISWIFVCSATFCIWERDWDYFVAFYFFFISLRQHNRVGRHHTDTAKISTHAVYLHHHRIITRFYAKLERTYEAGRMQELELEAVGLLAEPKRPQRRGSSLGTERTFLEIAIHFPQ
ncbi:hypothetical protein OSTOST_23910, partial [Ostertagia ostertagi]